ncbi:MAG: hypothetical protein R2941_13670 [Desulfobacterales bacterium]
MVPGAAERADYIFMRGSFSLSALAVFLAMSGVVRKTVELDRNHAAHAEGYQKNNPQHQTRQDLKQHHERFVQVRMFSTNASTPISVPNDRDRTKPEARRGELPSRWRTNC